MSIRPIENTEQQMTKREFENATGPITVWTCPLVVTEDMVGKQIQVRVTQIGVGGELTKSFGLFENIT